MSLALREENLRLFAEPPAPRAPRSRVRTEPILAPLPAAPPGWRLGTTGWSHDAWEGRVYPARVPSRRRLAVYAKRFSTVEVDATFSRVPSEAAVRAWHRATPKEFVFSIKAPREVTHDRPITETAELVEVLGAFLVAVEPLEEKLGPILLQFPAGVTMKAYPHLASLVTRLPEGFRWAVELRHRSWFHPDMVVRLADLLSPRRVALVWNDFEDLPLLGANALEATADFAYARLVGWRRERGPHDPPPADPTEAAARWRARLEAASARGLDVFAYAGNAYSGFAPDDVRRLLGGAGASDAARPAS